MKFVGAPTWEALSGHPVHTDVWHDVDQVPHVSLGRWADVVIVAPATANLLARAAAGMSDDLLTSTLLTAACPVLMAPAMHTEMWEHPATRANVATLRGRGVHIIDPAVGRLTGADSGAGRLPEPEDLAAEVERALAAAAPQVLAGRRVLVSAGGTREPLDPVRFLGNRSSGRQGWAIAAAARDLGAEVTLVAAHVSEAAPSGVDRIDVDTAEQMREAMESRAAAADIIIMAAAVADFRPARYHDSKIKKVDGVEPEAIELVRNPDILAALTAARRPGQIIVGFAAETPESEGHLGELARTKMQRKGCDLIVANDVSGGDIFGQDTTRVQILESSGNVVAQVSGTKAQVAEQLLLALADRR